MQTIQNVTNEQERAVQVRIVIVKLQGQIIADQLVQMNSYYADHVQKCSLLCSELAQFIALCKQVTSMHIKKNILRQ